MIAYHFPPLAGSSGIQRSLRFVQHLPALGWRPLVLSAQAQAYERTSDDLMGDVPADTVVRRAFALDTARHLQLFGRYPGALAQPDRWMSWKFDAVRQGLKLIKEHRPKVIWSTYPIATAHVIASELHRRTGLPWIADFRDPMVQPAYPTDPRTKRTFIQVEGDAVANARYCVFTTPGAAQDYRERYPQAADRMRVLENGYDEESFLGVQARPEPEGGPVVLLHSGIVYLSERDPSHLFAALALLQSQGRLNPSQLRLRFRAAVHDAEILALARSHGVEAFVEFQPAVPYREALREMLGVHGLLVLQASNCNQQVPAKVYEYLRAGRPILGLTDPIGDTAGVLRGAGVVDISPLDNTQAIAAALQEFLDRLAAGTSRLPDPQAVAAASRGGRSRELAELFDAVCSEAPAAAY